MDVGILSMQRVRNYGSFMQSFALKKTLENIDSEINVEFIDIKKGIKTIKKEEFNEMKKDLNDSKYSDFRKERYDMLTKFTTKYFDLKEEMNYKNDYDMAIIGSDEVFNCIGNGDIGFTPQIFGKDVSKYTISYAASAGHTTYEEILENNIKKEMEEALNELKNISVRDNNTLEIVKKVTSKIANKNIDPAFIFDFEEYIKDIQIEDKKYIVIYGYDFRFNDENEINAIKEFAKKNGLITIGVGMYQSFCDKNLLVTPFEALAYFKNAEYVITDTFHGSVFSIKYNKKFVQMVRESNSSKATDLLKTFGLEDRQIIKVDNVEMLEDKLNIDLDTIKINKIIKKETEKSKDYLTKEINKAKNNMDNCKYSF